MIATYVVLLARMYLDNIINLPLSLYLHLHYRMLLLLIHVALGLYLLLLVVLATRIALVYLVLFHQILQELFEW